jgi:hypothetical protein
MRYSVLPNPQRTQVSPMTVPRPTRLCIVGVAALGGQRAERSGRAFWPWIDPAARSPDPYGTRAAAPTRCGVRGRGPPPPPPSARFPVRPVERVACFCGFPESTAGQDAETCGERKAGDCGGITAAAEQKNRPPPGREFLNPYDQKAPSPAVLRCRALGVTPHPLGGVEARARFGILAREPAGNLDRIDTDSSRGHAASAASP